MITKEFAAEAGAALGKTIPPAAVVTASAAGYTLQDWTYIGTLSFLALQALYLVWKWWREWRTQRVPA